MRALVAVILCSQLSGCFFVFIPGALIDKMSGSEGEHCVGAASKVGDRISIPGSGVGTIESVSGSSMRCTDARFPIRAKILF